MTTLSSLRIAGAFALACVVAACGGDTFIDVPVAIGKRVVYVGDTATSRGYYDYYAADTGRTTEQFTALYSGAMPPDDLTDPVISPDGRWLGVKVGTAGACPSHYVFLDTVTGLPVEMLGSTGHCITGLEFNPAGGNLAVLVIPKGQTGAKLAMADAPDARAVYSIDFFYVGSVRTFHFSGDGSTIAWVDDLGFWSDTTATIGPMGDGRSIDEPAEFAVTYDGSAAVYIAPGETRFRKTALTPNSPHSETYLTAALAGGDTLGEFALSPDGTQLLYVAYISGVPQLRLVPLAAPLTEQRVDAGAPISNGQFGLKFVWNPDSTRFAWFGGGGNRVYAATLAAPTTAVVLSRASEQPYSQLLWSDSTTVVYDSNSGGLVSLVSVAATAPLVTVELSDDESLFDSGVEAFVACGDGGVVYRYTRATLFGTDRATALFSAQPMVTNGERRITPYYPRPPAGFGARLACAR
jgi:hypothetical protein